MRAQGAICWTLFESMISISDTTFSLPVVFYLLENIISIWDTPFALFVGLNCNTSFGFPKLLLTSLLAIRGRGHDRGMVHNSSLYPAIQSRNDGLRLVQLTYDLTLSTRHSC